jgi:hypothetical protein
MGDGGLTLFACGEAVEAFSEVVHFGVRGRWVQRVERVCCSVAGRAAQRKSCYGVEAADG